MPGCPNTRSVSGMKALLHALRPAHYYIRLAGTSSSADVLPTAAPDTHLTSAQGHAPPQQAQGTARCALCGARPCGRSVRQMLLQRRRHVARGHSCPLRRDQLDLIIESVVMPELSTQLIQ
ncbi:hypothetical protein B0H14DRAFT_3446506 [Mycena olivaceomarginata]|nr:hypothetical protein B0H14DRAFT_3446506 [Mycena olivaceomarginata]